MHKILSHSITVAILGLTSLAAVAATTKYDALVAFGDSYCDVGNLFLATGGAEPAAPYYDGRFSKGRSG
jgi:outer membrane lipase/esterase